MNVQTIRNGTAEIEFSKNELMLIYHAMFETLKEIDDWEFFARLGGHAGEARVLLEKILKTAQRSSNAIEINKMNIELSKNELLIINNSFNEVLFGFKIEQFEKRIGAPKDEVLLFAIAINRTFDMLVNQSE